MPKYTIETLPVERTPEQREQRVELWKQFNANENPVLSLAEVDRAIQDVLGLEDVFHAKKAIMRAFKMAAGSNEFIDFPEFRLFLVYLQQCFRLWEVFQTIASAPDEESRFNLAQLKEALPLLEKHGISIQDPEATFVEIDANHGGEVLFVEFVHWCTSHLQAKPVERDPHFKA